MTRSRRSVLGAVGAGVTLASAGCLDVLDHGEDTPSTYDAATLEGTIESPVETPPRPEPVQPTRETVVGAVDRIDSLLADVPDPLTAADVPNGAARREIDRFRDRAVRGLDAVRDAPAAANALAESYEVRGHARSAAETVAAVGSTTERRSVVEGARSDARDRLATGTDALTYAGIDPHRTLLTAVRLESLLDRARTDLDRPTHHHAAPEGHALWIGELAGQVERAVSRLAALDHLSARHRERAAADGDADAGVDGDGDSGAGPPVDYEERFTTALETAREDFREAEYPTDDAGDPRELIGTDADPAREIVTEGVRVVSHLHETLFEDRRRLGRSLATALELDVNRRALDRARRTIEEGGHREATPETVRAARESAVAALENLPASSADPTVGGDFLAAERSRLASTDDRIRRWIEEDRTVRLDREYALYTLSAARLTAFPDAWATFDDRAGSGE
ncbi:hypothetical protein SAMN05192561_103216 [Halopenitus malekzadehii]|uniref:Uncharacterized protein n=1 Tax=Halopenitus malekzadehii TaxID=1267564 RepID=A0A1H6IVA4_9EURY|nr:hypothetical protein [Halopenitus malekzadehii]SEH50379.1 hypothetical protein SAMN05192561_103216 [Halopenitus malekzadehii]